MFLSEKGIRFEYLKLEAHTAITSACRISDMKLLNEV